MIYLWKCSYAHSRLWSFIRMRICACMWICMWFYVDVYTHINIYASDYAHCVVSVLYLLCHPVCAWCVITRLSLGVHPCEHTPSAHGTNGQSDIFPDFYPRTELYSVPLLRSFIYFLFLSQAMDIFFLMKANIYFYVCIFISCMPTVILLYRLILWFPNRPELAAIKRSINQCCVCLNGNHMKCISSCPQICRHWQMKEMNGIALCVYRIYFLVTLLKLKMI